MAPHQHNPTNQQPNSITRLMCMPTMNESLTYHHQLQQQQQQQTLELFLSVPGGLEDVAVRKLPSSLLDTATHIHYKVGSGYLSLRFGAPNDDDNTNNGDAGGSGHPGGDVDVTDSGLSTSSSSFSYSMHWKSHVESISKVIVDMIEHPPLCIFAAYVSIGEISIPRTLIFDAPPKDLLDYCMNGFTSSSTATQHGLPARLDSQGTGDEAPEATAPNSSSSDGDLGLRWRQGLSVLQFAPSTLSERLASLLSEAAAPLSSVETINSSLNTSFTAASSPVRYRASFDRGDVQHRGVRSQDLAAALGGLTGDTFPSWKVNLKEFDVEIMGRWIQDDLEEIQYKPEPTADRMNAIRGEEEYGDTGFSNKRPRIEQAMQKQGAERGGEVVRMQVGITLPLAFSKCPYRFRPLGGRTSLRIEIAYTLLALADPKPGEVVVDTCSGVGTIPIVGAVHYPENWFTGLEVLPYNVERAAQNAKEMIEKVDRYHEQERAATESGAGASTRTIVHSHNTRHPSLIVGDARAVCWRSGAVDLIISDLPWGKRENSHVYNCKLYPRLIREIIRLLRVNGRAVLITGERKLLQRQLDAPFARPHLKLLQKREITIGYKVMVFELLRVAS
ncbi:THUMP domain-containing protein 3 [Linnemannia schmuckeri]|uniref:THUMP domain-containing protein 3 n=1 Tax=Linnemannia schmuckeri TaxID=64567 RepID=A0A9P5S336_9FUNG|nr:THUMP domain-containing protein 3 [Linnemannia schmuckeri]